jgi:hypothetical protein
VLGMRDDYFRPLTATMLNVAYFSPIFSAEIRENCANVVAPPCFPSEGSQLAVR